MPSTIAGIQRVNLRLFAANVDSPPDTVTPPESNAGSLENQPLSRPG